MSAQSPSLTDHRAPGERAAALVLGATQLDPLSRLLEPVDEPTPA